VIDESYAAYLRRMHLVLARGIQVSAEAADIYAHEGFPDDEMREGFWLYVGALVSLFAAQTAAQEEVATPFLRERLPGAPYAELSAERDALRQVLDRVGQAREADDMRVFLYLGDLQDRWDEHRSREQLAFAPEVLAEAITPEEQAELVARLAEYVQAHARPQETVLPFLLYNLPPHERTRMIQAIPPETVAELIPGPWQETWGVMRPFLLMET
jgi:hypothetical protein